MKQITKKQLEKLVNAVNTEVDKIPAAHCRKRKAREGYLYIDGIRKITREIEMIQNKKIRIIISERINFGTRVK